MAPGGNSQSTSQRTSQRLSPSFGQRTSHRSVTAQSKAAPHSGRVRPRVAEDEDVHVMFVLMFVFVDGVDVYAHH